LFLGKSKYIIKDTFVIFNARTSIIEVHY